MSSQPCLTFHPYWTHLKHFWTGPNAQTCTCAVKNPEFKGMRTPQLWKKCKTTQNTRKKIWHNGKTGSPAIKSSTERKTLASMSHFPSASGGIRKQRSKVWDWLQGWAWKLIAKIHIQVSWQYTKLWHPVPKGKKGSCGQKQITELLGSLVSIWSHQQTTHQRTVASFWFSLHLGTSKKKKP